MAQIDKEANTVLQWGSVGEAAFRADMKAVESNPELLTKYSKVIEDLGTAMGECAGTHGIGGLDWFIKVFRLALSSAIAVTKVDDAN